MKIIIAAIIILFLGMAAYVYATQVYIGEPVLGCGSSGVATTNVTCCTWDDEFLCTATATQVFTCGVMTADNCP